MSFSFPITESIANRKKVRTQWESDFEKNLPTFAENLALGIAKSVLKKLRKISEDPYQRPISSKNKFFSNISLEITRSSAANRIIHFTKKCYKELSPFNEWLDKFSVEKKQSDQYYYQETFEKIDRDYFEELMAIVGQLAETKINGLLFESISNSEIKDLKFKVQWYRAADQQFSNPSDLRDNCLCIELWLQEKMLPIPKQIEKKNSTIIEKYRVKQKTLQNNRTVYNFAFVIAVIIVGFVFFKNMELLK